MDSVVIMCYSKQTNGIPADLLIDYQKGDADHLYIPRTLGGWKGLLSVEDAIVGEEWSLSVYLSSSPEPLLQLVQEHGVC